MFGPGFVAVFIGKELDGVGADVALDDGGAS